MFTLCKVVVIFWASVEYSDLFRLLKTNKIKAVAICTGAEQHVWLLAPWGEIS